MSARKVSHSDLFQPVTVQTRETRLTLPAKSFLLRKNGIEFRTNTAIPVWTEMTVELEVPNEAKRLHCTGIVVACNGNRHIGFTVSMLFAGMTRHDQARLNALAFSQSA